MIDNKTKTGLALLYLGIGLVILLICLLIVAIFRTSKQSDNKSVSSAAPAVGSSPSYINKTVPSTTVDFKNWNVFRSKEIGIKFKYPPEFDHAGLDISELKDYPDLGTDKGKSFDIVFPEAPGVEVRGISDDFSAGRESLDTEITGFSASGSTCSYGTWSFTCETLTGLNGDKAYMGIESVPIDEKTNVKVLRMIIPLKNSPDFKVLVFATRKVDDQTKEILRKIAGSFEYL